MYKYAIFLLAFFSTASLNSCSPQVISFEDKHISYEGRIAYTEDVATLMWPGTSVKINFEGTGINGSFKDSDTANYYNIIVDKKVISIIHFDTLKRLYTLAADLPEGKHSLELFKRTEWDKGKTWFYGFESAGKIKLLPPAELPKRKIEFFGNSISCGYAIEDTVGDSPVGYFENSYDAYAAITARHFNAQYHCTAKSGIGITISWFPLLMSEMYDRLDPTDSLSKWNFKKYTPDIVVINLLQNDCWLVNMPEHEQFKKRFGTHKPDAEFIIEQYRKFVQSVRSKYLNATIICMLGNMDITRKGSPWPGYVTAAVEPLNDEKIFTCFIPFKETPGHPKAAEQKALAEGLIHFIEQHVKW